jgi:hypothetical protein
LLGLMAERSKAPHSSCGLYGGVGSNPTQVTKNISFYIFFVIEEYANKLYFALIFESVPLNIILCTLLRTCKGCDVNVSCLALHHFLPSEVSPYTIQIFAEYLGKTYNVRA